MLILFYDAYSVIHMELLPHGEMINAEFYCNVLHWLKEAVHKQ